MTERSSVAPAAATVKLVPYERIFLTGGSGYLGRNLIRHFTRKGAQVVALTRSPQSAELVRKLGAMPFMGNVLECGIERGMAECDALIHAAADTDHGFGGNVQRQTNEEGTRTVLAAARSAGIRKAIHISTESVLADGKPLVNVDETTPLPRRPAGSYSRSKAAAERIALDCDGPSFPVVVLRPRFVWGRDDTTALPNLVNAARSGQLAWISGGTYLTSTTHIANLCEAVELTLRNGQGGEIYFVSDDTPVEFRRFVTQLLETQGIMPPQKSVPRSLLWMIATAGDLIGALSKGRIKAPLTLQSYATSAVEITLNIGKASRELGYKPVVSREQGLEEMRASSWAP